MNYIKKFSMLIVPALLILSVIGCGRQESAPVAVVSAPEIGEPKVGAPAPQQPGEEIGISVDVSSGSGVALDYIWNADGGEIVRGQGSPAISYRVPEEPGTYNIRVKIEWDGQSVEKVTSVKVEGEASEPTLEAPSESPTDTPEPDVDTPTPEPTSTRKQTNTPNPPTDTPTPAPTNTPRPTPVPTATIDADPTVYDNFNNPAFDGNWNTGLWSIDQRGNTGTSSIVQQNGVLVVSDAANSTSYGIVLKLHNWKESTFNFFEIKVMLSSEKEGSSGNISINAESPDIPGGWTELGIGHHWSNDSIAVTGTGMNDDWVNGPEFQYDTWHKLRIEFDNQAKVFTYFVDDQIIATRNLPASNEVTFEPVIQLWHENGTSVKAFVDEVRIG